MHVLRGFMLLWSPFIITVLGKSEYKDSFTYMDTTHGDVPGRRLNPTPSKDAWYKGPDGWEQAKPGDVLRIRPHAYDMEHPGFSNYIDVAQVLFRSTDGHQRPLYAATTVFIPKSHAGCMNTTAPVNCSHALLSYHIPYDTACLDASLSWSLQKSEPYGEIAIALSKGYFVSVPDYEGPRASYGANVLAGQVILDSIRALKAMLGPQYGFQTNSSRVAFWGYSSGGTATEFAAELAATYAPDLKIDAAVIGGLTANITKSLPLLNGKDVAGLMAQGLIGTTNEYPEQRKYLDSILIDEGPYNRSEFLSAATMSGWDSLEHFAYQNMWEYFKDGESDVFTDAMVGVLAHEGVAGIHGTPNLPVFYYHAVDDEMCPIEEVERVVKTFCDKGARAVLHRNVFGNHNEEGTNGRQRSLDFLSDVLEGTNKFNFPAKGCRTDTLTFEQSSSAPWT